MKNDINGINEALSLLAAAGMSFEQGRVLDSLKTHTALVQEWNRYASLVSIGDAQDTLPSHCVDSISLAPYVQAFINRGGENYVDIGTGGGFPAIPLCILFPELKTTLVERNTKKTVFLKKVVGNLSLANISVTNQSFEGESDIDSPKLITARAIEKPDLVIPGILGNMSRGDCFLCQSESIHEVGPVALYGYAVTAVEDEFSATGMRRNRLYQIEVST